MSLLNRIANLGLGRANKNTLRPHPIPGGIKPPTHKARSLRSRIMPTPIPERLLLVLSPEQASPPHLRVREGDRVLKFQLLADTAGDRGAAVHAPTSGIIDKIAPTPVANETRLCIQLLSDGEDEAIENSPVIDFHSLNYLELLGIITAAGISGSGGAGFPSWKKLQSGIEAGLEVLIINALECEPFISCDEALIRERAEQVVAGAEILLQVCRAAHCIIAIEDNKADAIAALELCLASSSIKLLLLAAKYPAGSEKQLIQAVTGLEVPSGELPASVGAIVQNVGTAHAVYQAVVEGKPCINRITTLAGMPLQTPKNFETLIGTPVSFLYELCGADHSSLSYTILGGSLMGVVIDNIDSPVTKTTNCIIAASAEEFPPPKPEQACIRCGACADVCPVSLLPQQLYAYSRSANQEQLLGHGLLDCIECGACAYVCPSHIPLVQYYRASKAELQQELSQQTRSEGWQARFQYHQYRVKKDAEESSAKPGTPRPKKDRSQSKEQLTNSTFSREQARAEIADAVRRVQARRTQVIASSKKDKGK